VTRAELDIIRERAEAALTYERTDGEEDQCCPLCDTEGYVEGQRYDAKETIAATVVAYGIGRGLALAEKWVEDGPRDMLSLLEEVARLAAERDNLLAWSQRFSDLVGVDGSTEAGRDEAFAKLYDSAKASGKLVRQ
jgi:hypothetical protein